ncbi:hypothetical protein EDB85DRAFT_2296156, partial [Lactarius pseudohatsudake]
MFNFVSSFGALASSSVTPIRKPTPPVSHQQGPSVPFEDTWPSLIDPKRRFVDNLHEQLSVSNAPAPPSAHPVPAFDNPDEETPITETVQFKAASRPLPFELTQVLSPRDSPPKISPPVRWDLQAPEFPLGPQVGPTLSYVSTGQAQREKEISPGPRGSWKGHEGSRNRGLGPRAKTQPGPISQPQTIVVDVAQPLDDTQARLLWLELTLPFCPARLSALR